MLFGLSRDFIHNGGNYMVLSSPEGIPSSELSRVQTNMISAAKVPHLLPLHMKEVNFKVSLQYEITNKKMLTHLLKSDKLTLNEYYSLLLQIVSTLDDSKLYMLDPEQYILQEDYIFIEGPFHMGTVYLTYIPIPSVKNAEATHASLHQLITRLMASVSELQGNGIQSLLHYVSVVDEFTWTGLKGLLINLMSEVGQHAPYQSTHRNNDPSVFHPSSAPSHQSNVILQGSSNAPDHEHKRRASAAPKDMLHRAPFVSRGEQELVRKASAIPPTITPIDREHSWINNGHMKNEVSVDDVDQGQEEHETSSMTTYVALGCLITCAVIWRFLYMTHQETGMLMVCILITVLLGAIAWLGWKGKLRLPVRREQTLSESIPLFDPYSGELENYRPARKVGSSFQVERLTGFFGGETKDKEPEPSRAKWEFPDHTVSEHNQAGSGSRLVSRLSGESISSSTMTAAATENNEDDKGDYYAQLGQRTEMLSSPRANATVLLKPDHHSSEDIKGPSHSSYPYLERREIGQGGLIREEASYGEVLSTPIVLNLPHFIIGRATDVAQFVEVSSGTSRAHVEISKGSEGYVLKDLGSKNGTLLNKEPMIAYKEYPLHDGDIFTIIKGEYTYHLRS